MKTKNPLPRIVSVKAQPGFKLDIEFDSGEQRCFDLAPSLDRGVFQALRNILTFERVRAHPSLIEWPGDIDLSADTLYLKSQPIQTLHA